jgi:hypothetical protein
LPGENDEDKDGQGVLEPAKMKESIQNQEEQAAVLESSMNALVEPVDTDKVDGLEEAEEKTKEEKIEEE